ncbi:MAG: thioesterase, partial [Clostridiaceae bacterium]|nr:thioesterase [Clostridiaceae bacterium]
MEKINLFCIPYAGGSATSLYKKWNNLLGSAIEVIPVELPGRGARINEPLLYNYEEVVNDIYSSISNLIDSGKPYALFGYSMGSWLSYELAHKIMENGQKAPIHAFFAAKEAPHVEREGKDTHKLGNDEFINEVIKYGGMTDEFLKHEELLELFLPILRADYEVSETYRYTPGRQKLDCDITIFNGEKDHFNIYQISEWRNQTNRSCKIFNFNDGHFFIDSCLESMINIINATL